MAAEVQSDRMESDMEAYRKLWCGNDFLHVEKNYTHGHTMTPPGHLQRPTRGCDHSEEVGGVVQQS